MLHSECEAVEHIALEAGAVLDGLGRQGAEEVWIVLAGSVRFSQVQRGVDRLVRPGQLILCRDGGDVAVANDGDEPAELLLLQCLPPAAALRLPPRSPVVEGPRR
jgi:quercetin dioxygenase-like cupin family protein